MKKVSFEALQSLTPRSEGLTKSEVLAQRSRYGSNEIVEVSGNSWFELALDTLKDPMIWFLLGIGTVFIFVGDTTEALILFVAILPLVFMDAILHWRTQASTESLKGQLAAQVVVFRDGKNEQINSQDLVPGDLVLIEPGLYLPADGVFQNVTDLQIDESALTGESISIAKTKFSQDPFISSGKGETSVDPRNLGFAGTRVLTGSGKMRVLLTGQQTTYGEIVQSVSQMPHERTPLQKSITSLVQGLIVGSGLLCILLAGVRIYQGHGWLDALLSAATLAIAAIPEEFPVVFTFFLGVGVYRLAQRRALVRRAVSVENIGRVTHICTDKTGTITKGILQLTHRDPGAGLTELAVLETAFAASNPDGADPVDVAIRDEAKIQKLNPQVRSRTFPFTEDRKQETAFVQASDGKTIAYMKGAPETVFGKSDLPPSERQAWAERTAQWAREGHKVLACARKVLNDKEANDSKEPESGFEFCGLLAFEDPPRPEVRDAIAYCQKNRIGVLMITGDHKETAIAIAKQVGLGGESPVAVSAEAEPEKFEDQWLAKNPEYLRSIQVVSRCSPLQKLKIVTALKKSGELVAVTGDGVNDVPALKAADIGIVMGERGTRSAKEVASIVLADDNFSTIVAAIKEGRQLFVNLSLSFKYLLFIHVPLVLTAAVIPLLGYPLIYLPVHIVWLELIIHPSALFAFQQPAEQSNDGFKPQVSILGLSDLVSLLLIGLGVSTFLGMSFVAGLGETQDEGHARAIAMVTLTLWSAGVVAVFSKLKTRASLIIFMSVLTSTAILVQVPGLAQSLHLTPLHLADWIKIGAWIFGFLALLKIASLRR